MDRNKFIDDLIDAGASDDEIAEAMTLAEERGEFATQQSQPEPVPQPSEKQTQVGATRSFDSGQRPEWQNAVFPSVSGDVMRSAPIKEAAHEAVKGTLDVLGFPVRALGTLRKNPETNGNYKLSDTNSAFFRPEIETVKDFIDNSKGPQITTDKTGKPPIFNPMGSFALQSGDKGYKEVLKGAVELGGNVVSDPTVIGSFLSKPLKHGLGKVFKKEVSNGMTETPLSNVAKNRISEITQIDRKTIQNATNKNYLDKLKQSAKDADNGGIDELVGDAQQKITEINKNSRVAANNKIELINKNLDDQIKANIDNANNAFASSVDINPQSVSTSGRGLKIEESIDNAREAAGKRFGKEQERYLNPEIEHYSAVKENGESFLDSKFAELSHEVGYDGQAFRGVEKFDNSAALPTDIADYNQIVSLSKNANTTGDMLNQLRLVRKLKGERKPDGSFYNSIMLGKIDNIYNEAIEKQLTNFSADNNITDDLVGMWRANNQQYKSAIDALEKVKKGIGINKIKTESYIGRIQDIGIENLYGIKQLAAADKDMAQVWNELSNGFIDNIVAKSLDGNGNININTFKSVWNNLDRIDQNLKSVLIGSDKTSGITNALNKVDDAITTNKNLKLSGELQTKLIKDVAEKSDFGKNLMGTAALSRVKNIGKDTQLNKDALSTLEILDEVYGTAYAKDAMDFYKAKQLSIGPQGNVPWVSQIHTGRSVLGPVLGQAISDIPVVGKTAGLVLGLAGQSPAGAIAFYKLLDNINKGIFTVGKANKSALAANNAIKGIPALAASANNFMLNEDLGNRRLGR